LLGGANMRNDEIVCGFQENVEKKLDLLITKINDLEYQMRSNDIKLEAEFISLKSNVMSLTLNSNVNLRSYSQCGEDMILTFVFKYIGKSINDIVYLDIGANHYKNMSNTFLFHELGGNGVTIEANPMFILEHRYFRPRDLVLNIGITTSENNDILPFYIFNGDGLSTFSEKEKDHVLNQGSQFELLETINVPTKTINQVIEQNFKTPIDFITIDVEGLDLEILQSLDFDKYAPIAIVIEVIEFRPYLASGIKNTEFEDFLKTKGYVEFAFTGVNSIFVKKEYFSNLKGC
jgi:FkbM family methyltransferase